MEKEKSLVPVRTKRFIVEIDDASFENTSARLMIQMAVQKTGVGNRVRVSESSLHGAMLAAGQHLSMRVNEDTQWAHVDHFIHSNVRGGTVIQIRQE